MTTAMQCRAIKMKIVDADCGEYQGGHPRRPGGVKWKAVTKGRLCGIADKCRGPKAVNFVDLINGSLQL